MVWLPELRGKDPGRPPQPHQQFRAGHGQAFSGADEERDALPSPGIDLEPQSRESLRSRVRRHALLRFVAAKLPANEAVLIERRDRFQHFDFFIADRLTIRSDRRLHSQVRQDLKKMILYDVANRARLVVKSA